VSWLRWDLPAADLDQVADHLRRMFGNHLDPILNIDPPQEFAGVPYGFSTDLPVTVLVELAATMIEMTAPEGLLDPGKLGSEIPWTRVVVETSNLAPKVASRVARRWAARLFALQWQDHAVEPVVEAVAHFSVAWAEGLAGRPTEARRWSASAATVTDHEGVAGLSLATWVRAAQLLRRS
jgi:hypothetical protein